MISWTAKMAGLISNVYDCHFGSSDLGKRICHFGTAILAGSKMGIWTAILAVRIWECRFGSPANMADIDLKWGLSEWQVIFTDRGIQVHKMTRCRVKTWAQEL